VSAAAPGGGAPASDTPLPRDLLDTPEAGPRVIRGGALRVAGHVAGLAIALVSISVLNRHLGVVDVGRYVTVLSLAILAAGLSDAGLQAIGVRECAVRRGADRELLLRNLITLRIALTSLGMLGAVVYALVAGFGTTLVLGTVIAGAGVLAITLQSAASTVLIADLRLGWVTLSELLRQLVGTLAVIALAVAGAGLLAFFVTGVIGALAALALTVAVVRRAILLRPAWDADVLRALAREAAPYAAATIAAAVYLRVGMLIVALVSDARQTGYYGTSFRVVEAMLAVPALAVGTAFPVFARAAGDDARRLDYAVRRTFATALLLGAGVAVLLGVGAPVVIDVVGGDGFAPAADVLRIHAIGVCLSFASIVLSYALLSLHAHRALLTITLTGLAVVLAGSFAGAEIDGARGAAVAAVLGELALTAAGLIALARRGIRLGAGLVVRPLLAAALAVAPALVLSPLAAAAAGAVVFVVAAVALGAVPDELYAEVRRRRRRSRDA
jgi:O-antigen/teichoic acid export membrane protein